MNCKVVKLIVFVFFLSSFNAFSQNKTADSTLINRYNHWLKTIQLDQLIHASEIKTIKNTNPADTLHKLHGMAMFNTLPPVSKTSGKAPINTMENVKVLIIKPSSAYTHDLIKLASGWNYIRDGLLDSGVNISQIMLIKFADYAGLPVNMVKIELQTERPDIFSLNIYFDKKLVEKEVELSVKGGDLTINYNFDTALNSLVHGVYLLKVPISSLKGYYPDLKSFFERNTKHDVKQNVTVSTMEYQNTQLQLAVTNAFGEVTGEPYHEIITLTVTLKNGKASEKDTIEYNCNIGYAGGMLKAGKFIDVASEKDFSGRLKIYNRKLDTVFKRMLNGKY